MPTVRKTAEQARKVKLTRAQKARLDAMTDAEITAAAKSDPDNPPLSDAELAQLRRGGRPPLPEHERKKLVTLRLAQAVLKHYRALGRGWQTQINNDLLRIATLDKPDDLLRHLVVKSKRRRPRRNKASKDYAAIADTGDTSRHSRRGLK